MTICNKTTWKFVRHPINIEIMGEVYSSKLLNYHPLFPRILSSTSLTTSMQLLPLFLEILQQKMHICKTQNFHLESLFGFMAVDAVASLVLQKLSDFLSDDSFPTKKVISHQLKHMQKALEKKRGFLVDAAEKEANAKEITEWTKDYLRLLYSVEDSIELFAVRITRQRKRMGCVMDHALFLNKFTDLKMLIKLHRAQKKIKKLNSRTPSDLEDASLRGRSPRTINSGSASGFGSAAAAADDDGTKEENSLEPDSLGLLCMRRINSTPVVSKREGSPRAILSGCSFKMRSCIHASLQEHWPQSELMNSDSYNEEEGSPRCLPWEHSYSCNDEKRNLRIIRSEYSFGERWQHAKLMYSFSFNGKELSIIGYKSKTTELMNRLDDRDDHDRIISIVGELGSGKTMLARAVYGDRIIKKRFNQACALVSIFRESTTTDILLNLLKQVKNSKEEDGVITEDSLKCKLLKALKDQKYLIVLDDVQSSNQWESLKDAFPEEKNGSKIILTTRSKQLAVLADSKIQPNIMGKLDPAESWALFKKKAGLKMDPEGYLKEKIIEVCQDLPLNIVMLGSLLSTKQERRQWFDIVNSPGDWQTLDIVMMSYLDLDAHLKLCLLYMMLFPKELDIPVRRLQRLWLAEGFVKQQLQNEEEFQEDVAQEYFDNLVRRSLVMVTKLRSDGSPRRCRLLGVLHDLLLAQARDISLFHVHFGPDCQIEGSLGKRRLVEYADAGNCPLEPSEIGRLRSYISFNLQKKDTPAKHVSSLLSNMVGKGLGLLRVLDLEGVYQPSLPENLGDLVHLRYLGLRWTFLDKLPKSVGELLYLETLDLKHTRIDKIPAPIWKLKNLRHLNLDEVHLDKDTLRHLHRSLPRLLTLWGLSVSHESPIKNGLSKLKHLRELGISFRLINCSHNSGEPTKVLVEWISELKALRSLRLRSKDDCGHPADLSLKSFSGLTKLSHMKLLGKLKQLPPFEEFPPHIKVLTLSLSSLSDDPMSILGKLPDLTVLRLLGNSYTGDTLVCESGTFKKLEVLKLWSLKDLEKWEVRDGAMEKLKEANIRRCSNLEKFPSSLLQQKTFKELILNNMPPAFKEIIDKKYQFKVSTKDFKDV